MTFSESFNDSRAIGTLSIMPNMKNASIQRKDGNLWQFVPRTMDEKKLTFSDVASHSGNSITEKQVRRIYHDDDEPLDLEVLSSTIRSVVGTIEIAGSDPDLTGADEYIRATFSHSLERFATKRKKASDKTQG
jgi:hypothetical protein